MFLITVAKSEVVQVAVVPLLVVPLDVSVLLFDVSGFDDPLLGTLGSLLGPLDPLLVGALLLTGFPLSSI